MVLRIEDISFIGVYVNDSFRDFKDINDYANYHVSLLNNKRYQAFSGGDFIDRVVKGGYATDPNYKRALSNVYNQIAKAQEGMKIPKLKGVGELRNRILRQFNREKAANRNEEQLIGFDWSRYKSNKPKPETTPTQSEQLENGGVIKAQDGIIAQAINKVKSFLPKEEPKEPVDVVDIIKEYAPSAATSFLSGSVNPFINKLLEGKKPSLDYSHKFGSTGNKFEEFASVMTPIFKEALEENGLPITNLNNLVRQAALESNYGLDPRGERGFNLSGIKHPGDSIAPKYKKSRYKDGFDYIDFDNLKDYANYKVKVLNDRYKALDAKDTNDFIDRLHGNNSGGYNYSADKDSYRRNLNGTLSLNKYLKRGGILKYQNPSSGIKYMGGYDKKGNMVLPVTNENGMNNVTLPEVTVTPRNINLAGAVDRGRRTVGNIGKEILSATTPLGDIESAKDIYQDTTSGNYGQAALGAGLLALPNFIEKPAKALKQVGSKVVRDFTNSRKLGIVAPQFQGKSDITDRFLKYVGGVKGDPINMNNLSGVQKMQATKLQEAGVDLSRISLQDLQKSINQRKWDIVNSAPNGRFNVLNPSEISSNVQNVLDFVKDENGYSKVGRTELRINNNTKNIQIGHTDNESSNKAINKVAERGLNSAIQLSNQTGLNGVLSGEYLLSAPKTYSVWKHFKNKELYGNYGEHSNTNMINEAIRAGKIERTPDIDEEIIIDNIEQMKGDATRRLLLENAPVYRLTKESGLPTKTKSVVFDPSIIDKSGKMNIDWNNPNIYKASIPIIFGLNSTRDERH